MIWGLSRKYGQSTTSRTYKNFTTNCHGAFFRDTLYIELLHIYDNVPQYYAVSYHTHHGSGHNNRVVSRTDYNLFFCYRFHIDPSYDTRRFTVDQILV